ncbi:MAG: hypothetical protein AB1486_29775 [Planctomycetota bacterium]
MGATRGLSQSGKRQSPAGVASGRCACGGWLQRWTICLPVILILLGASGWLGGNIVLETASRRLAETSSWRGKQLGLEVLAPRYERAIITSPFSATWRGLGLIVRPLREVSSGGSYRTVTVGRLTVSLASFSSICIEASDVDVRLDAPAGDETESMQFVLSNVVLDEVPVDLLAPAESVRGMARELLFLARHGSCETKLELWGWLRFRMQGVVRIVCIAAERRGEKSAIVMERDNLRKLAEALDMRLTEAETTLLAEHPLRVPRLLRIKTRAASVAKTAHERDARVPEDAYRHVLWSYLLAKEFGEEFAECVTNAHEEGDTGNTPEERSMDCANNAVGRLYARDGLPEGALLQRVLEEARVVREPAPSPRGAAR